MAVVSFLPYQIMSEQSQKRWRATNLRFNSSSQGGRPKIDGSSVHMLARPLSYWLLDAVTQGSQNPVSQIPSHSSKDFMHGIGWKTSWYLSFLRRSHLCGLMQALNNKAQFLASSIHLKVALNCISMRACHPNIISLWSSVDSVTSVPSSLHTPCSICW